MTESTEQAFWIVVGSPGNFDKTRELGFTIQGLKSRHRKKAERMKPGDKIAYYVTGRKAFAAISTITSPYFESHEPIWKSADPKKGRGGLSVSSGDKTRHGAARCRLHRCRTDCPANGICKQMAGGELDARVSGQRPRDQRSDFAFIRARNRSTGKRACPLIELRSSRRRTSQRNIRVHVCRGPNCSLRNSKATLACFDEAVRRRRAGGRGRDHRHLLSGPMRLGTVGECFPGPTMYAHVDCDAAEGSWRSISSTIARSID